MLGLEEYIQKHGRHFTEELAYKAAGGKRWTAKQVETAAQRRVWYNVTGSTLGDMTYETNSLYFILNGKRKDYCIRVTLAKVGCYCYFKDGGLFMQWVETMKKKGQDFDFTPYI